MDVSRVVSGPWVREVAQVGKLTRLNFGNVRGKNREGSDRNGYPHRSPRSTSNRMLITKTHRDVPSALDSGKPIRIFIIAPNVPGYPQAKFPGRPVFAETFRPSRKLLINWGSKALFAFLRFTRSLARSSGSPVRLLVRDTLLVGRSITTGGFD